MTSLLWLLARIGMSQPTISSTMASKAQTPLITDYHRSLTVDSSRFHTMSVHVFLSSQNITWVFACSFSWATSICLNLTWVSLVQDPLYYFDLTLGFSHSSRSLRSTYLGCSFNFCLFHLTVIFGGSFDNSRKTVNAQQEAQKYPLCSSFYKFFADRRTARIKVLPV